MKEKKNLDSVQNEQFSSQQEGNETTKKDESKHSADDNKPVTNGPGDKESDTKEGSQAVSPEGTIHSDSTDKPTDEEEQKEVSISSASEDLDKEEKEKEEPAEKPTEEGKKQEIPDSEPLPENKTAASDPGTKEPELTAKEEKKEIIPEKGEAEGAKQKEERAIPDYSKMSREDLIKEFALLLENEDITNIREDVEQIRSNYEKNRAAEIKNLKKSFLAEGGKPEDFKPAEDPLDFRLKDLMQAYREKKNEHYKKLEEEKTKNLEEKYTIIEEIKDLINRKESLNKTFNEFNELQARWRETGLVPQANVKELWETYHHHVEKFYDYIKINKELRDLDFKKNLEAKTLLCEKAEELLLEPNIVQAFRTLQIYHDQWREIGPVPPDMRAAIWERFKEATAKINKKHQEYFDNLKDQQKNNLEQKKILCEKAEEITAREITSFKEWDKRAHELKELQRIWKTIGFAPKKDNNAIYARFRLACDTFFSRKREFFARQREAQQNNLQLKTDLCVQAEAIKDSTDWRKTTDELIKLQKEWKEIGPVPRKHSDAIWKRFRAACDDFFNRKEAHFSNIDSKYEDNLNKKEALIEQIKKYEPTDDAQESLNKLKDFQKEWAEVGYVPIKDKDRIQQEYRNAINDKFDHLKLDERKKYIIKYKSKLEDLTHKSKADIRMRQDREKFLNKLKQLENDIVLWENNIGFFSNSKNAEKMIQEVENKIKNARKNIELLKQKIVLIEEKLDDFE